MNAIILISRTWVLKATFVNSLPSSFRLFTFPTVKKNPERREKWKQLIGRKQGSKLWSPPKYCRVCSRHFVDGEPTLQNPLPTLHLGYDDASKRVKRMNQFEATKHMPKQKRCKIFADEPAEPEFTATPIYEDPEIPQLTQALLSFPPLLVLITVILVMFNFLIIQYQTIQKQKQEIQRLKDTIQKH
ncbi:hypothetical protein MAR_025421 [Mya arenaria]|uniref:THAP-type domain-containing protein n=1 Tax=Mya arenaria TaxID=6604 RepID=A0ABY7DVX5_MYAAR|nr:hypothetical protein MAR_025421 [Mya arenaria]